MVIITIKVFFIGARINSYLPTVFIFSSPKNFVKFRPLNEIFYIFMWGFQSPCCLPLTIMMISDGWTNGKGRTLINFLVNCPRVTIFIKTVDALAHVKDATLLCELIDGFIQEIDLQQEV